MYYYCYYYILYIIYIIYIIYHQPSATASSRALFFLGQVSVFSDISLSGHLFPPQI